MTPNDDTGGRTFDFAQFLVDSEMITPEQAHDLRNQAASERAPIGQVLLQTRVISVKQLMSVLAVQASAPAERFGQIALRLGYVTLTQLQAGLDAQQAQRRHAIEAVVRSRLIETDALLELVVAYVRVLELTLADR